MPLGGQLVSAHIVNSLPSFCHSAIQALFVDVDLSAKLAEAMRRVAVVLDSEEELSAQVRLGGHRSLSALWVAHPRIAGGAGRPRGDGVHHHGCHGDGDAQGHTCVAPGAAAKYRRPLTRAPPPAVLGPVSRAFTQILLLVITHTEPQLCVFVLQWRRAPRQVHRTLTTPLSPQLRLVSPGVRHAALGLRVAVRGWQQVRP